MDNKAIEKRACQRFKIPGATVNYKLGRLLSSQKYVEKYNPVSEISRGGIRFLSQKHIATKSKILLKISIPDEKPSLILKGRVRWVAFFPSLSYKYQIGVEFDPFGERKECNSLQILERLIALEKKFLSAHHSKTR